ncbi:MULTISPECIES: hypothetical protein [Helicobacter]|uniref:Uncharacterized protein n=1 Tax=Helicobacter colisuis TaxID=2949739 RepID=A0ABT0TV13_9HELI|nr:MULTISPECIES: hypothetical protein [Helicobacter]MCI2235392.1 hypothetical protein [Helicobacter sp. CaF467b]MCI7764850.1 hypothetical protein [Helicobacter sp.]MCL9819770.1 hypothetical protein [Helicobacter colisuis]MCL9821008.1 hypothetical protein [Helicobacter colisuis]MCL9823182.1 hypothetical protein [Helicobacter colisuis]
MSKERIKELEEEIEELSIQLSDMLCVALKLSGVVEAKMQEALDAYIDGLDEESLEYGVKEILENIEKLKKNNPEFFGKK